MQTIALLYYLFQYLYLMKIHQLFYFIILIILSRNTVVSQVIFPAERPKK